MSNGSEEIKTELNVNTMESMGPTNELSQVPENEAKNAMSKTEGSCGFYLKKKKRYCKLLALETKVYCVEHAHLEKLEKGEEDSVALRIQCPLDPNHTVYQNHLKRHMHVCNSRVKPQPTYYKKNANSKIIAEADTKEGKKLKDLSEDELKDLLHKIGIIYTKKVEKIPLYETTVSVMGDSISSPDIGHQARRHLVQIGRIISLLESLNVLKTNTIFVEFGSGKGHVSYWLGLAMKALKYDEVCKIVLVDKESHRHKRDNKLTDDQDVEITRVRVDIKDLVLNEISQVNEKQSIVAVTKHLCGSATDLALRSLFENAEAERKVEGLAMATCCHHKCTWDSFVGKKFLLDSGFGEKDFTALCSLTSWAVCGTGTAKFGTGLDPTQIGTNPIYQRLSLTSADRREIGYQAKKILDRARANYIEMHLLKCKLVQFASREETHENIVLVAGKDNGYYSWLCDLGKYYTTKLCKALSAFRLGPGK